jgi:hypothetical protein
MELSPQLAVNSEYVGSTRKIDPAQAESGYRDQSRGKVGLKSLCPHPIGRRGARSTENCKEHPCQLVVVPIVGI